MCDPSFFPSSFWQGPSVFWWWWGSRIIRPCFGFGSFSAKCGVVVLMLGVDCGTKFTVVYVEFSFKRCWCLEHIRSILWESAITRRTFVKAARHNNALFSFSRFRLRECVYLFLFLCDTQKKERKKESICVCTFETFPPRLRPQVRSLLIIYSYFLFLFLREKWAVRRTFVWDPALTDRNWQGPRVRPGQIRSLSLSWLAPSTCQIELKGGLREVAAS